MMCDGMGWFSSLNYKEMLLVFDKIYYLLPEQPVEFNDISGRKETMFWPAAYRKAKTFAAVHFVPSEPQLELLHRAAQLDVDQAGFESVVKRIPVDDAIYTWRAVNSDGDLNRGQSLNLKASDISLAHALLLCKFLLAANAMDCIPISGKPHIYQLLSIKHRASIEALLKGDPGIEVPYLNADSLKINPIARHLVRLFIPSENLEGVKGEEIIEYKNQNRELFDQFSLKLRELTKRLEFMPFTLGHERALDDLIKTDAWKEKAEIEGELRAAWEKFFKSALRAVVAGSLGVAITPLIGLAPLTLGALATATATIGPLLTSELVDILLKHRAARRNGLYYLMDFPSSAN